MECMSGIGAPHWAATVALPPIYLGQAESSEPRGGKNAFLGVRTWSKVELLWKQCYTFDIRSVQTRHKLI